ncbi:MAG: ATP-grasp domain-containing protein [Spirochaetales bacterium]|nr:ATP-grasp domain-containing protein [Spirochaetales bacterium]
MILNIIGGGPGQLSAIMRSRKLGMKVLVTDINSEAPGCLAADFFEKASTFDAQETEAALRRFQTRRGLSVGAVLVTGTDQPVLTAAVVSKRLGIPYFLSPEQALWVTNKKAMKTRLSAAGIRVSPYTFVSEGFRADEISSLSFPVVVKPLDSQGQRGVYRLETAAEVADRFSEVAHFSRESEILVEEYYESDEVTLSGWVEAGRLYILTVTDRRRLDNLPGIGVCISHQYPSRHIERLPEIRRMTEEIVLTFGIKTGPVYFQYLIGEEGIIVNETACRLGGAYEDEFIPFITGVDILDVMIKMSCGLDYDKGAMERIDSHLEGKVVSLQMFFCREGRIDSCLGMEEVRKLPGVTGGAFLLPGGTSVRNRLNSTQRSGYFIVCCSDKAEADEVVRKAYSLLRINDENGQNMIRVYDKMFFGG